MLGRHCLKTWSKTQAIIAKSSAEAELYGVVRGATEGLGMVTLLKDLGSVVGVQMHVDASAAMGIIERQGLSRVRHIDTNVLWLQEVCARKVVLVQKVPGEMNPADLTTKHLSVAAIENNTDKMSMVFETGRAAKAAKLHSLQAGGDYNKCSAEMYNPTNSVDRAMCSIGKSGGKGSWSAIRRVGNDLRGGDRWKSRGDKGVWHRWHLTPRVSLFTPYKVAKGPTPNMSLQASRFTCGVTESGQAFEFVDDWTRPDNRHRTLSEPWIGFTIFTEKAGDNFRIQQERNGDTISSSAGRWADVSEEEW